MIWAIADRRPEIHPSCFIAPDAALIGSIVLEPDASIWFGTILRGDNDLITISQGTNIQDGSVVHTDEGIPVSIGAGVTVGHKAVLHGCRVGENSLIGINAVILNNARVGANCIVGAGALIPEGKEIPDNSVVFGTPGKVVREVSEQETARITGSAQHYMEKARIYAQKLRLQQSADPVRPD
ncbi:gamma carbonic anhydrase family protein [Desulfovermiculus halophilus]|jgi:carbonic anhydrase/acetyltransferase-like protein (isoleucine patch superfamily)|uniref:gamma carbonic anhydrase family protein n=1 Tax=Desulfovermiculus halophilus TaxID=339722 RepID=UPI0004822EEE|nr:gamma carbonic anhydrase family protein [Desulfovermiculus halophilus]